MKETFEKNDCGRAGQLVGYLYGESGARERADFERHLRACAPCRDELAAFAQVRGSVADFREGLLRTAPSVSLDEFATNVGTEPSATRAQVGAAVAQASRRAESRVAHAGFASHAIAPRASAGAAWAALREFFRLSPAWLRATTAAAAFALCALALMAVANAEVSFGDRRFAIRTGTMPVAPGTTAPASSPPAKPEEITQVQSRLDKLQAERDAALSKLEETRAQLEDSRAANLVAAEFEAAGDAESEALSSRDERRQRRAPPAPPKSDRSPRGVRRATEDEDLPRLLDLLGDAN